MDRTINCLFLGSTQEGDVRHLTHELPPTDNVESFRLRSFNGDVRRLYLVLMVDVCYWLSRHPEDARGRRCDCNERHKYCTVVRKDLPHIVYNVRTQYPPSECVAPMINGEGHILLQASNEPHEMTATLDRRVLPTYFTRNAHTGEGYGYVNDYKNLGWEMNLIQGVNGQSKKYNHVLTVSRESNDVCRSYGKVIAADHQFELGFISVRMERLVGGNAQIPQLSTKLW